MNREEIFIRPTRNTPEVHFADGRFSIEGRSIPENPGDFYRPLYEWLMARFRTAGGNPVMEIGFDYLNTASAKWIFLMLRDLAFEGVRYRLVWYYESGDDDMYELGMMFKTLLGCPFAAIEVESIPANKPDLLN